MTASQDVRVHQYRQILVWPFRLEGKEHGTDPHTLREKAAAALLDGGWAECHHLRHHIDVVAGEKATQRDEYRYQEYVYFYSFVRNFLFDKKENPGAIRLFQCPDYIGMEAAFGAGADGFGAEFQVERANMYLFDTGIAVLALEMANDGTIHIAGLTDPPMRLKHAQIVQEKLRRAYPPFWHKDGTAGLVAQSVRWRRKDGVESGEWRSQPSGEVVEPTFATGEPPLAGHWKELLKPLLPDGDRVSIRQVVDDRIPLMLYLRVGDPAAIGRGDWVRLAMCDEVGDLPLPYGADFLTDFERQHCYDRHWIRHDDGSLNADRASRYLFSGYGFVAVGGESNEFFEETLLVHFRRHYFQLALLAQFEYATLLAESERLAKAESSADVETALDRILTFTKKYWFVDVSNQVQAREMYGLWRRHLNTVALYDQVREEARAVADFQGAKADRRTAEAATRLTLAALLVAVPSLATGFLGMNVLVTDKEDSAGKIKAWSEGDWSIFGWTVLGAAIAVSLVVLAIKGFEWLSNWFRKRRRAS